MTSDDDHTANRMLALELIDADFYSREAGEEFSTPFDAALHYLTAGEAAGLCPSGWFDPRYYIMMNPDLADVERPIVHYLQYGRDEGRIASLASQLLHEALDEIALHEGLIPPVTTDKSHPAYLNALARSLRAIDTDLRYFSREFYRYRHIDVAALSVDPILHYLRYGRKEGRQTNVALLKQVFVTESDLRPDLPFILIGVHEASKTGAPIVGMDLATELASTHNVIFISLADGPLMERAKQQFPIVIVASQVYEDNLFLSDFILDAYPVSNAIFSSVCCAVFIYALASRDCKITCLVHEFLEYMLPFRNILYVTDLLVFSSHELLRSWQTMLDNHSRDPATVLVLPQPASATSKRQMTKSDARKKVRDAIGIDLENAVLVLGAGQVQIRKGTDIFLQVGNQLAREPEKYATIWIGEQVSEFDMAFGIWFHAQLERSRDPSGRLAVHFEPAGPLYPVLMDAADVFLVTSRLDPLPNVALDAAARGLPVIAFAGATGLADVADRGEINLTEVQIGAIDEMIAAIKACSRPVASEEYTAASTSSPFMLAGR